MHRKLGSQPKIENDSLKSEFDFFVYNFKNYGYYFRNLQHMYIFLCEVQPQHEKIANICYCLNF